MWSPVQLPNTSPKMNITGNKQRPVYSHEEYINLILNSGQFMSHDYSNQSVEEDPRMIAFFDSLVQRELEGNSSDPEMMSEEEEIYERFIQLSRSDISDSSEDEVLRHDGTSPLEGPDPDSDTESIDDPAFSPFTLAFASVMAAQATDGNQAASRLLNALPGERDNQNSNGENQNSHKNISDLIAQKRNEMKKRVMLDKSVKRRRNQFESSESSEDDQLQTSSLSGHPVNIFAAQTQRRKLQLKRLKQLRNNVLQTEEGNSSEDEALISPVNNHSEASTSKGNPELGPFLSENSKTNVHHNSCVDSGRDTEKLFCEKVQSCSATQQPKTSNTDHHVDHQQPGCSHENEVNSDEEGSRQKWTEFKRFKNRSKKNKRTYRRNSERDDV